MQRTRYNNGAVILKSVTANKIGGVVNEGKSVPLLQEVISH
jgi:hypothetical protein